MSDATTVSKIKQKIGSKVDPRETGAFLGKQDKPAAPKMDIRSVTIVVLLAFAMGAYGITLSNQDAAKSTPSPTATAPASAEGK